MGGEDGEDGASGTQDRRFFAFPFEPYDIQLRLMRQLYATLDSQHVGIFESPTGTGKSVSLICGALAWLSAHTDELGLLRATPTTTTESSAAAPAANEPPSSEPSWLAEFGAASAQRAEQQQQALVRGALSGVAKVRAEQSAEASKKRRVGLASARQETKRRLPVAAASSESAQDGDEHLVDAYDSDRVAAGGGSNDDDDSDEERRSGAPRARGARGDGAPGDRPDYGVVKLIYCSRTHSQISQFVREIRRTAFGARVRVVSLGSRKNLCTNPRVTALRSDAQMTDACLDMLQNSSSSKAKAVASRSKKKRDAKCPFYDKERLGHFRDHALAAVRDIEDLHDLGSDLTTCAYYGTRESVPLAQVVAMPYAMLLSKDTRESLGIELAGAIVVFDEAHNIVEAVNSTYTVEVSSKQLVVARRSLWAYFTKYEKRFQGKNAFYIKQLLAILELLTKFLRRLSKSPTAASGGNGGNGGTVTTTDGDGGDDDAGSSAKMMLINDFLFSAKVDHFNLFKILQYLNESGLAKKLLGFMDAEHAAAPAPPVSAAAAAQALSASWIDGELFESRHVSPLRAVEALLKALTSAGGDGRVLAQPPNATKAVEGAIKFIQMNPAVHFEEIVAKARSVILAGGTMQPVAQVIDQLFPFVPRARIDLFSCGHVIPPQNLVGFSLSSGPSQQHLEFTFARRGDTEALDELGRVVLNLARIVPGGIVVFFPSYRFEEAVVARWQATTQFGEIDARKKVFREPKQSDELASVLAQYSAACRPLPERGNSSGDGGGLAYERAGGASRGASRGAVLLSVVGGKMSEGINFSDELARCVVMVGLPYPNARDAELVEKMAFLDRRSPGAGRRYYESLCMKAVNQSIGRSIRHQKDYASIMLVDHRYASPAVRKRLPEWIQERVQPPTAAFGHVYAQLVQFYRAKEQAALADT